MLSYCEILNHITPSSRTLLKGFPPRVEGMHGAGIAQLVVLGLAVQSVAGSILLWGNFPEEGIFPLELTWLQTPFPQNSFG